MTEDNQLAIVSRQGSNDRFDFDAPFFSFAFLLWSEATTFNGQFILITFGASNKGLFASSVAAQMIDGGIMSNLVDPGGKLKLSSITRQRAIDLYENLLSQVQRCLIIADHAVDVR